MHSMHMVVLNAMHLFPHTRGYTCHTANDGHSVVAYVMVHVKAMQYVSDFELGQRIPESHHLCIHMYLEFGVDTLLHEQPTQGHHA